MLPSFQLEPWMASARCASSDPEAFFPEKGGSTREAKRICAGCDVAAECLEYALARPERFGIWGGRSERERRKVASKYGLAGAADLADDDEMAPADETPESLTAQPDSYPRNVEVTA